MYFSRLRWLCSNLYHRLETPPTRRAMEFELKVGRLGNVRTATFRAFTEEEITRVVDKLG